jgi:hypothetical protein
MTFQNWELSHRADAEAADIADRHYNRQKPGTPQFVPPGRCIVLKYMQKNARAFWVTSWPFARYVKHQWGGAWVCSAFRKECDDRASDMIRSAVDVTRYCYGEPPELGMVTFIDKNHVQPIKVRGAPTLGRTWILAGFKPDGQTKGGLLAFRLSPEDMPRPQVPLIRSHMQHKLVDFQKIRNQ